MAQNRVIAAAAARPLAVALARAFASVFDIPQSSVDTESFANLDSENFSDSVSNTETEGEAEASARGEGEADIFDLDGDSSNPRLGSNEVRIFAECTGANSFEQLWNAAVETCSLASRGIMAYMEKATKC